MAEFRPGQFCDNDWYAQYVGQGLTKVPKSGNAPPSLSALQGAAVQDAIVATRDRLAAMESGKAAAPGVLEEETLYWTKVSGIFYCKQCELFRSGNKGAILNHLLQFHQVSKTDLDSANLRQPVIEMVVAEGEEDEVDEDGNTEEERNDIRQPVAMTSASLGLSPKDVG